MPPLWRNPKQSLSCERPMYVMTVELKGPGHLTVTNSHFSISLEQLCLQPGPIDQSIVPQVLAFRGMQRVIPGPD
jgi:hypothetical protein